jgi:hypothetical protein
MVAEVKFDQLKRCGPANTKGNDLTLQHTEQIKSKIRDESPSNFQAQPSRRGHGACRHS